MAEINTFLPRIHRLAPQIVADLVGEVDLLTAPGLRERLGQTMVPRGTVVVVVEASAVTFMDCSGLRGLLAAHTRPAAGGRTLVIRCPSPSVARLVELTGLTAAFDITLAA